MDTSEKASELSLLTATEVRPILGHLYRDFFKRAFDILLALIFLPVVLTILLILIIVIKLDSKGPAIFKSERIGKNKRIFHCYKLRTMFLNSQHRLDAILNENPELREEYEKFWKLKKDPRITRIGKFLRVFSFDEIPQIFNVLKGDMSFVGPRPTIAAEIPRYGSRFDYYSSVSPGITGLWQISGRNDTTFKTRVNLDYEYIQNLNLIMDLKILLKTIPAVVLKKGAY